MGYPYPVFVRWDDDDLPDLVCPNETNRIFWYKNRRHADAAAFRSAAACDSVEGYEDSPQARARSAQRAPNGRLSNRERVAVLLAHRGAALADFNGDGLTDLVTLDGETRKATLFVQFRGAPVAGFRLFASPGS